ncbi:MAG: hypothetical protein ACFCUM_08030 [Bacteroidales bacterium]
MIRFYCFFLSILLSVIAQKSFSQAVPAQDEHIPYLVTFGPDAGTHWGDDDYSQAFFFLIPESHTQPVYIRVYDPDTGGAIDELNGYWNSKTNFSVYGGRGCHSHPDARDVDPTGNYRSGNMLASRTFGNEPEWDRKWYTFGPFNPTEGEFEEQFGGYVFKIIAEGIEGGDGNLYRYFLSTSPDQNIPIEGANAFAYEYTFRLWDDPKQVSHIYPFIDEHTITIEIGNFDWDNDGIIRLVSVARQGQQLKVSGDDEWQYDRFAILPEEHNTSLDIQFHKQAFPVVRNNNVVVNIRNQRGEGVPFYTIPIGGVPQYQYSIGVRPRSN